MAKFKKKPAKKEAKASFAMSAKKAPSIKPKLKVTFGRGILGS